MAPTKTVPVVVARPPREDRDADPVRQSAESAVGGFYRINSPTTVGESIRMRRLCGHRIRFA